MDVFALQEELDNAKVARSTHARNSNAGSGSQAHLRGGNTTGTPRGKVEDRAAIPPNIALSSDDDAHPPHLIRDDDTGLMIAAQPLHPLSAEYKLRQRYFVHTDEIVGRGAFGEVLLAQLRDVPIVGNSTFAPMTALLGPYAASVRHGVMTTVGPHSMRSFDQHTMTLQQQSHMHHLQLPGSPSMTSIKPHGLISSSALSLTSLSIQLPPAISMTQSSSALGGTTNGLNNGSITLTSQMRNQDVTYFAVKRIDKSRTSSRGLSQLYSEVETLSLLNHSNIVKLQEVFQDNQFMFIIMEYVRGGELGKVLKRVGHFTEAVARKMCLSILLAIEYIHDKGIVHRDLKPANCLLTKETVFTNSTTYHFAQLHNQAALQNLQNSERGVANAGPGATNLSKDAGRGADEKRVDTATSDDHGSVSPVSPTASHESYAGLSSTMNLPPLEFTAQDFGGLKLADFGFAAMVGRAECLTTYCGTMHFMAPEVVGREGVNYGKPVDMWSFGVIVYNLLSGDVPFSASSTERLVELICSGNVTFPPSPKTGKNVWATVSPQAKEFIQKLLAVDPTRRLTAQEALRHPWIRAEYSDEDLGDYPTTKGILRAHSKFIKNRTIRHRLIGAVHAVIAAHRLIFYAKLQAMKKEGISEIPVLRHLPFMVHGTFEPPNHIAAASSKRFTNNVPALKRLAEMVAASHTVEVLDVSGNNIDDLGLVQLIVKVSYAHPSLLHLNMERNPIPPLAARALLRLARSPTHKLNIINVNHTNLGIDVIAQIDGCLKETIRKRAEAASSNNHATSSAVGTGQQSPIVASSSILRHDNGGVRIGLMQSLTSSTTGSLLNVSQRSGASPSPSRLSIPGSSIGTAGSPSLSTGSTQAAVSPSGGSGHPLQPLSYRPPVVSEATATIAQMLKEQSAASILHQQLQQQQRSSVASPGLLQRRQPMLSSLPPLQQPDASGCGPPGPATPLQQQPSTSSIAMNGHRSRLGTASGSATNMVRQQAIRK